MPLTRERTRVRATGRDAAPLDVGEVAAPATRVDHPTDRLPLDDPYFGPAPRAVTASLVAAVVCLPLLIPSGPGNTGLADLGVMAAVVAVLVWLKHEGTPVAVPYLLPVGILVVAGSVAAYHVSAETAMLPVVQDLFLLAFAAAVANAVRRRRRLLEVVLRAWVWSGVAWAAIMCTGKIAGIAWMGGLSARDGGRASLTFDDPNLAANYFLVVLALLLASSVVRRRWARVAGTCVVLLAIVYTGSNGAALGLVAMTAVAVLVRLGRRHGITAATAVAAVVAALVVGVAPHVSLDEVGQKAADSVQVLRDSLGRSDESSGSRTELANETLGLFLGGDLVGVGAGRTKATLKGEAAPYVKEAHNDYLATLVERGALGGAGLVVLLVVVGTRLGRVALRPQSAWVSHLVPRPEVLLGLGCALAVAGLFYEVLHFRHVWALLGLVAGVDPGVTTVGPLERARSRWAS